jgi:hypothetical protein
MLFTNKATPTRIGSATLGGKGTRLFNPKGFASGEATLLVADELGCGGLGADDWVLLVAAGFDWAKVAIAPMSELIKVAK